MHESDTGHGKAQPDLPAALTADKTILKFSHVILSKTGLASLFRQVTWIQQQAI